MELKGSETEKNLMRAFAGESQARNRYTYYADIAEGEGYLQIAQLFRETADNEKEHAKVFFKLLAGGMVAFDGLYPAGPAGTTEENLLAAAEGEKEEWSALYPGFSEIAEREGFKKAAATFRNISKVESWHERRYRRLLENVQKGLVFKRDEPVRWKCDNCGYVHEGPEAPKVCPACAQQQKYFELFVEAY